MDFLVMNQSFPHMALMTLDTLPPYLIVGHSIQVEKCQQYQRYLMVDSSLHIYLKIPVGSQSIKNQIIDIHLPLNSIMEDF